MKLYHHPFSSNARTVAMAAVLLDMPLEHVFVDLAKGQHKTTEYLAINPRGQVPVLVDGDFTLSESLAIITYLATVKGETTLYPAQPAARADVHRWMFFAANHVKPPVGLLMRENVLKKMFGGGEPDATLVEHANALCREAFGVLDRHLETREWVSGTSLTLADVALAVPLMTHAQAQLPLDGFAFLGHWFARVQDLDAWKRTSPG